MSYLDKLTNANRYSKNLNIMWCLCPCKKSMMLVVEVHTNGSTKALSAVLLLKYAAAKYFHPVAYYSKKFNNI